MGGADPPGRTAFPAATLLGVRIHLLTMAQAVEAVRAMMDGAEPRHVLTAHTAMLARARSDPALRDLLNSADLATPDGFGILLVGRILGVTFPERVAGVDLAEELCRVCVRDGRRVFLLGARPGVAEAAAAALARRHPGLQIAGTHHGFFGVAEEPAVVERIRAARPHLLLVGMGFPQQEQWIARMRAVLGVPVSIGVGGTLDVMAGLVRRAPRWVQRAGLEWAYRALQEPRRWRVAATIPGVVLLAVQERLRKRAIFR
ncbi:MAG TPA: WecB/TagA/CpsF family glycosyltransferase [bacterium]|nr:WecB/TagA/CpsF family glycosyltransferase [bacterium]